MSPAAYRARKAARLCVRCRAGLQPGDGVRCVECQAEARAWDSSAAGAAATKRKRDKRRSKGQCHADRALHPRQHHAPLNKAEAHRLAHKLRDPKFYTARTKRAVNSLTVERGPKVVPHE